ncbi:MULTISPECIES: 2,3-diaminopropionate biosynthesis protein SbnB [Streptomyces]|uniref:Ornithine cyclodeaminase n=1 Tax=Streptomyces griseus subsp. griseus (strain JCM 4626 / CBS 651.72 / NBRC 13350 / KCC S-0626 / ISP 5235) TaxID=455632 RepID=B1W2Q6_STRGG|nr:2,3-diaminopropionate biosynthesis protein SbnB [Streptomyces griseus]BAG19420.1 putative ornithine cyclodeaminase [Streptomyces griseus subsp. griseus NBRC 13350]SEE90510.1 ornithine cyclodeaminase [Streptomyces griseus]SQA21094.1 ornithine cyclodeaminase [Streptomyces griseus]
MSVRTPDSPPSLIFIPEAAVAAQIEGHRERCVDLVRRAYLTHDNGDSVNPQSGFLRLPDHPKSRIISLPAHLGGEFGVSGLKWISSFPDNPRTYGIPRASAVLLLNDPDTGYPAACLESSVISATRTAASAVLAAETLGGGRSARRVGVVGTGLIARHVWKFLRDLDWQIDGFTLYDLDPAAARSFGEELTAEGAKEFTVADDVAQAFTECDLVILTTVAGEPHIHDPKLLDHAPLVLHLSLRDLAPEMILAAQNITDDTEHAVRERTSLHLTEQAENGRDFITGTLADVLLGRVEVDRSRPVVFSPFGLGVLDLAVGSWVHSRAQEAGAGRVVNDFFASTTTK